MENNIKKLSSLVLAFFLSTMAILAQDTSGRIVGTVTAPDGVVPGATIVITDNQTQKERTVTSSGEGTFTVQQLEFGTYTVRITAQGFKTFTATDVKIDAGREFALTAQLEVGEIAQEVTVTAGGAEAVNATNAELSTTVSTQQIKELPLNGRNPLSLLSLQAGANPTTNSINGQRSSSTDFRRDGLNIQDNFIRTGGFVSDQPTVDDTGEFTVTTQNAGVEQGGGSSLVSLVTPRGGSEFHGNLYAFNRNSKFAANSFFNNFNKIPRPFLNRNQFGGSFSGPVPVPSFGEGGPVFAKNKGFFFFNYEGFRLAQQVSSSGTTLLAPARNGNFTFVTSTGLTQTINVLTGQSFNSPLTAAQGGVLSVDPIIQSRILANLPTSGNGATTGTNFTQVVNFQRADPRTRNSYTGRFDVDINDRNTVNFVYRRMDDLDARAEQASGFSTESFVNTSAPTDFMVVAYRTSPLNNFSNEIRGGFQKAGGVFVGENTPTDFQIGNLQLINSPEATFFTQGRRTLYRNIQDNAVYSTGNHSFRFGGQAELYQFTSTNAAGTVPTYNIAAPANTSLTPLNAAQICGTNNCIDTTELARANTLRYLLGGIVGGANRTANLASLEEGYGFGQNIQVLNYEIYSAYGSDQWRVRPNLTLNLGLRYELWTPVNSPSALYLEPVINGDDVAGSITNPNGQLNIVGGNAGKKGDFFRADKNNFAPSISFAYSPKFENGIFGGLLGGDTVLRGGFRISYVNDEYVKAVSTLSAGNSGLGSLTVNGTRPGLTSTTLRSSLSQLPQFESLPIFTTPSFTPPPRSFALNNAQAGGGSQLFGIDPNIQLGKVYEWNVGIQREIGFKTVLELRYVGNTSNDLVRTTDFNEIDIINNNFLNDVLRAQANIKAIDAERARLLATGLTQAQVNAQLPRGFGFNPNVPGAQQLTVLNQTVNNGATVLANTNYFNFIEQGEAGRLAQNIVVNGQRGNVTFQANPNVFLSEILTNAGKLNYNALQAEVRRRFSNGLYFQVNYTFQKTLTDVPNEDQNRQGELQDSSNPKLNYGRADFDRTHTVNANMVYELPFGKGKRFLNQGGLVDLLFGGYQFGSIVNLSSGPPLGIIDPRGTRSIAFKSGRQSASSTLSSSEIKDLTGVFHTPNGIYFIDPKVLFATATAPGQPTISGFDLNQPLPPGYTLQSVRGASPVGTAPFPGQVFFFNNAGETGNLPRNFINGTPYINWDASLSKNIRFGETRRLQLRMEAFNVLNNQVHFFGADLNVASTNFGQLCRTATTCTYNNPRIVQFGARFDF